ncbi:flagellar protein FlaG [Paenibacillus sp. YIM B09110]|uniref:flagellar protein FlaG n=1 Tax=Paenibacillus sp. YIM B09110 TaxID=3126102 RepID=UPI00301DECBB
MINISSNNTAPGFMTVQNVGNGAGKEAQSNEPIQVKNEVPKTEGNVSKHKLEESLDRILKAIQGPNTTIERSIHEGTKQVVYKVKDNSTGEVLRQFPEEKLLDAAAKIIEITGIMVDEKV